LGTLAPATPRFALSYAKGAGDSTGIKLEIAPSGKPEEFTTYLEGGARRRKEPRSRSGKS
jgi:hypothetical protein